MRKFFAGILVVATVLFFVSGLDAKPPSGGFRSSSSRSSSFSSSRSSSSTRSSGWGSKSSTSSSASKPSTSGAWGSKSSTAAVAPKSATDVAAYKAAKTSGKAFTTRDAAVSDFKAKAATKYTSTYKTEPTTRPTHIPQSTNVGGANVNISYNSQYGGYGYMHPSLGTWMMYDMISDAAMMSTMMSREGYYVGGPPVVSGGSALGTIFSIILATLVIVVVISILSGLVRP